MDSWLKKSNDDGNKLTADDVEAVVKANATLTCSLNKRKLRKMRLVMPKRERIAKAFSEWFHFHIGKQ